MKKVIFGCCAIVALAAFTLAPQAKPEKNEVTKIIFREASLSATLTGAAEVPGPGDLDGRGTAEIYINQGQGTLTYVINVENISPATGAHLHEAPAGSSGPIIVPLMAPSGGSSSGVVSISKELAKEIRKNPAMYYVNVHNAAFPSGAVRGQLSN